eukprot:m.51444 g.51444  ORF g.51444 m.51444 type:complete len:1972 (-) comp10735_c1_seq1:134-6049(-)
MGLTTGLAWFQVIIIYLVPTLAVSERQSLSDPKVLLPLVAHNRHPISHILWATGGCYSWTTQYDDVAKVEALYHVDEWECIKRSYTRKASVSSSTDASKPKCSRAANVTASLTSTSVSATVITAIEQATKREIRCDVFVRKIHRITIVSSSKTMYLDHSPFLFQVDAFDSEGNTFTTLGRMVFKWKVLPVDDQDPESILQFENFLNSSYVDDDELMEQLELEGNRGFMVLVRGVGTGRAILSVTIEEPGYESVASHQVILTVRKKVELHPYSVYLIPNTTVPYHLYQIREHKLRQVEIKLPHKDYSLAVADENIMSLQASTSVGHAKMLGVTKVVVNDAKMNYTEEYQQPQSVVHVVEPWFVEIRINGQKNVQALEVGRDYSLTLQLLTSDNKLIQYDSCFQYALSSLDSTYFETLNSVPSMSQCTIRALKQGTTTIAAKFVACVNEHHEVQYTPSRETRGTLEVDIYMPVTVIPQQVLLPWVPGQSENYQLRTEGGSGRFYWNSSDPSVVKAGRSGKGLVKVVSMGEAVVEACDVVACDEHFMHKGTATIKVAPPVALEFLASTRETRVGESLELPLAVLDSSGNAFLECSNMKINFEALSKTFRVEKVSYHSFHERAPSDTGVFGCISVKLVALVDGNSEVRAEWSAGKSSLQGKTTVFAFSRLTIDPVFMLLAVGSCGVSSYHGGPAPLGNMEQTRSLKASKDGLDLHQQDGAFTVCCQAIGNYTITLTIGNKPSPDNTYPRTEDAKARVTCESPYLLTLIPTVNGMSADVPDSPCVELRATRGKGHVLHLLPAEKPFEMILQAFSKSGKPFTNFSSWKATWTVLDDVLKIGSKPTITQYRQPGLPVTNVPIYSMISQSSKQADLKVVLAHAGGKSVEAFVRLQFIKQPKLSASDVTLLNDAKSKETLPITDGSGLFKVLTEVESASNVAIYSVEKSSIVVQAATLGKTVLTVADMCTIGLDAMHANVKVVKLEDCQFRVNLVKDMEVGQVVNGTVCLLDSAGIPLSESQLNGRELTGRSSTSGVAKFRMLPRSVFEMQNGCKSRLFELQAMAAGRTFVEFSFGTKKRKVKSRNHEVDVYPSCSLQPSNFVLAPGVSMKLRHTGGPDHATAMLFFASLDENVATVSENGVVRGVTEGKTKIRSWFEVDSMVHCEQYVTLEVTLLSGIKIVAPSTRVIAGSVMDVYVGGLLGETPMAYNGLSLLFRWSISNTHCETVSTLRGDCGSDIVNDKFSTTLNTKSAGKGVLSVRVTDGDGNFPIKLLRSGAADHASIAYEVVRKLELLSSNPLYLPVGTDRARIKTSLDGSPQLKFSVLAGNSSVLDVSPQGEITTKATGTAVIMVSHAEAGINQTLPVYVHVSQVSYITLSLDPASFLNCATTPPTLAIGVESKILVTMHHASGRAFDTAYNFQFSYLCSNTDVVEVTRIEDNAGFYVTALDLGSAVLSVSFNAGGKVVSNFLSLHSSTAIVPAFPVLHVGGIATFRTLFPGEGSWTSSDPRVLSFSSNSSYSAIVVSPGNARVTYTSRNGKIVTHTDIVAAYTDKITVDVESLQQNVVQSVLPSASHLDADLTYKFSLDFETEGRSFSKLGIKGNYSQQVPFKCDLEPVNVRNAFHVESHFDTILGSSACVIRPVNTQGAREYDSDSLQLVVSIAGDASVTQKENVKFVPAFFLDSHIVRIAGPGSANMATLSVFSRSEHRESLQLIHKGERIATSKGSNKKRRFWKLGALHIKESAGSQNDLKYEFTIASVQGLVMLDVVDTNDAIPCEEVSDFQSTITNGLEKAGMDTNSFEDIYSSCHGGRSRVSIVLESEKSVQAASVLQASRLWTIQEATTSISLQVAIQSSTGQQEQILITVPVSGSKSDSETVVDIGDIFNLEILLESKFITTAIVGLCFAFVLCLTNSRSANTHDALEPRTPIRTPRAPGRSPQGWNGTTPMTSAFADPHDGHHPRASPAGLTPRGRRYMAKT